MPKISIIVPVYGTEKYLRKCLDSLVNQTLEDIEILVINDGTKDNSQEIIDEYSFKYPEKIKAFKKENSGLSSTRNFGLSKATGDYIGFIDSDDYVALDIFEKLYNKAIEKDFDVTICNVNLVYENNGKVVPLKASIKSDLLDKQKVKESMISAYTVVWNKIYKRELLYESEKFLEFKPNVWYEDIEWMLRLFCRIKSIGVVNKNLYFYLQREKSITYTYNDKLYDIISNMDSVIEYYKTINKYVEYKPELEYLYARYALATFIKRLAKCKDKKKFDKGVDFALKKVNETFPDYKNNVYMKSGMKGRYIKIFNKFISNIVFNIEKDKESN